MLTRKPRSIRPGRAVAVSVLLIVLSALTIAPVPTAAQSSLTLSVSPGETVPEDAGTVTVTAELDEAPATTALTVTITAQTASTAMFAAQAGDTVDAHAASLAITIGVGETSGTASFTVVDDEYAEEDETLVLNAVAGSLTASVTITIEDNDTPVIKITGQDKEGFKAVFFTDNDFHLFIDDKTMAEFGVQLGTKPHDDEIIVVMQHSPIFFEGGIPFGDIAVASFNTGGTYTDPDSNRAYSSLTFDQQNWNMPQSVTIRGHKSADPCEDDNRSTGRFSSTSFPARETCTAIPMKATRIPTPASSLP